MARVALSPPSRRLRSGLPLLEALLGVLAFGLALRLRLTSLDAYTGSFDEGIRAEQLLLMSAGYRPFRDIFASQGPLLLDLLYPFFVAFGESITAARLGVVACSLVTLIGGWWVARLIGGPMAGLAALLILGLSPTFLDASRLALAEVPTLAPSVLAIGCLLLYRRSPRRGWLVLSATLCALALLIKPMALHVGAPLAVLLLVPAGRPRAAAATTERGHRLTILGRVVGDVTLYGVVVLAVCAVVIIWLGPARVWDNLGAYRGGAGHGFGADAATNLRLTMNVLRQEQVGFFVLAAAGAPLAFLRNRTAASALLAWAAAVLGLFALYGDLADKHIVYLVPPLALLGAVGAGIALEAVSGLIRTATERGSHRMGRAPRSLVVPILGALGVLAYVVSLWSISRADLYLLREAPKIAAERRGRDVDREIAEIIRSHTPPDGWVLADNPGAAFEARRLVIPYLVDTSGTRIDAGSLTSAVAYDHVQSYRPSVIVTWPRRLGKLDDFVGLLPQIGYRLERSYDLGWKVYVRD
jgi:hypothetical protein